MLQPRHTAFVAWETLRAYRRVARPKVPQLDFWYDVEDPDVQAAFQSCVDLLLGGATPDVAFPEPEFLNEEASILASVCFSCDEFGDYDVDAR